MIKYALIAAALTVSGAAVHYAVPQTDVVRVVGVEAKRVDVEGASASGGTPATRDVYFVQAETIEGASPMVYRNEDKFIYLKWNSADVQARSQSLAADQQLVAIRHYGWRVRLFSAFPNVLSVSPVETTYSPIPLFFMTVLALVWGGMFLFYRKISNKFRSIGSNRPARGSAESSITSREDLSDFFSSDSGDD